MGVSKSFESIQFINNTKDSYNISVQFDGHAQILTLNFTNRNTKKIFEESFDKYNLNAITSKYHLEPLELSQMIIDTLASKEKITKHLRIFTFADIKQAIAKYKEIREMKEIPNEMDSESNNNSIDFNDNQTNTFLLFVLNFSLPPYIVLNYCFIIGRKDNNEKISDYHQLSKANGIYKQKVSDTENKVLLEYVESLSNTVKELTIRVEELEAKSGDETPDGEDTEEASSEEVDLRLENCWARSYHYPSWELNARKV
mmetsp:Transcript_35701/g.31496  ORF Transcript_35701/g.31496 Transcript_35701/m.31496 type:complete len:257 (-) Transcript_35701:143-913(-)